jgi:cytoskeletal protein RodZ
MALSMDEQRILDEIERGLASADPALATRMSSFGVPRRLPTLRMRRLRLVASLMTLVVVAMVSVLVYALVPFRSVADRHGPSSKASSSPAQAVMTAPSHQGKASAQASAAQASAAQASAAPASASPASPALGISPSAGASASLAPSTHAGASASPAIAHQQARGTPAQ